MTFLRLWVLLFLPLPLGWIFYEWNRHIRRTPLLIKAVMMILGILALSEPVIDSALKLPSRSVKWAGSIILLEESAILKAWSFEVSKSTIIFGALTVVVSWSMVAFPHNSMFRLSRW